MVTSGEGIKTMKEDPWFGKKISVLFKYIIMAVYVYYKRKAFFQTLLCLKTLLAGLLSKLAQISKIS